MKTVKVTGYSDDNIDVDGDLSEEFGWYPENAEDKRWLLFSDGTVLECQWDVDGNWRFNRVQEGAADFSIMKCPMVSDLDQNTDIVTLTGDLEWVKFLNELPTGKVDRLSVIESKIACASKYAFDDAEEATGISKDDILYLLNLAKSGMPFAGDPEDEDD